MNQKRNIVIAVIAALIVIPGTCTFPFFGSFAGSEEKIIYIQDNESPLKLDEELKSSTSGFKYQAFRLLANFANYYGKIRPGRYDIGSGQSTLSVFRKLRNGSQTPVKLIIPVTHTLENLCQKLDKDLELSGNDLLEELSNPDTLAQYGLTPETAMCLFIPNTYEVYWTISPKKLVKRMHTEYLNFWTKERMAKLDGIRKGFTREEAITLASIVEQESQNNDERPDIAGLYINRLNQDMPLQADPTIKFALKDFELRRILHGHLSINSPYNTYKNIGLPPGPICNPSISSINAVLDYTRHNYIYMCAKEDFSGTHNFAATYEEHLANAAKYSKALDERGIK